MRNFIDISSHQAGLRVRDVPTEALIVKATEGRGWRDTAMPGFVTQARSADKPLGFYAFVSQGNTPVQEADNLLSYTERHRRDNDVVVLDWEPGGNSPGPRDVDWARRWLEHVSARIGNPLWSYMNLSTANGADWRSVTSRWPLLWLAHYPGNNTANGYVPAGPRGQVKGSNEWQLAAWQFTDGGRLPGWGGRLDLNELYVPWWDLQGGSAAPSWDGSPVPGYSVTTPFGKRGRHWSTDRNAQGEGIHTGDDYAAPHGTPVVAVVDGTVTVRDDNAFGCMSILKGDNGRFYWYCHLQRGSRDPWQGERVRAGQQIARVGQTGNATGPHLHLEDCGSPTIWRQGLRKPSWPRPAITITRQQEEDVPDIIQTRTTYQHPGEGKWLRVRDDSTGKVVDTCPAGKFAASAQIHGPREMRARYCAFVGGDYGGDGWWRGMDVPVQGKGSIAQAGNVPGPVQLDIWMAEPGEITVEQQCTHWPA